MGMGLGINKMVMSKRNNVLSLVKIIACISVFIGHYFDSVFPSEFINGLRFEETNHIIRMILIYFTQGDLGNIAFFVGSGYLISYYYSCTEKRIMNKITKYVIHLLIPSILIILLTAFIYFVLSFVGDESFIFDKVRIDISNLLFGGNIYYGRQLWYINCQIVGYILCTFLQFLTVSKNNKMKYFLQLFLCLGLIFIRQYYYFGITIGLIFGNIMRDFSLSKNMKKIMIVCITILSLQVPYIFSNHCNHWDNEYFSWGYIPVSLFYALIISCGTFIIKKKI